jgi:hypothetical protein
MRFPIPLGARLPKLGSARSPAVRFHTDAGRKSALIRSLPDGMRRSQPVNEKDGPREPQPSWGRSFPTIPMRLDRPVAYYPGCDNRRSTLHSDARDQAP